MRIVCSGCGAQHWLSDMEVSRGGCTVSCPNCGTQTYMDASRIEPQSLEPRWYYAVNDDSVGPLSTQDLEFSYQNGQITLDSYVWCEGMSDWMALSAVPELAYLMSQVYGQPAAGEDDATRVAGGGGGYGGYGYGATGAAASSGMGGSSFDQVGGFGSGSYNPFGGAAAGGSGGIVGMDGRAAVEEEPEFNFNSASSSSYGGSSSPSRPADANEMIGARSENSVLFSLSSLQSISGPAPSQSSSGVNSNPNGAGLIDVKALASSAPVSRRRVNEPVNSFGSASAVPMGTVLPLGNKKDNTPLFIMIGLALLVLIGLGVAVTYFFVTDKGKENSAQNAQVDEAKLDEMMNKVAEETAKKVADEAAKKAEEEAAKKAAEEKRAAKKKADEEAARAEEEEEARAEEEAKKAEEEAAKKADGGKKAAGSTDKKTATAGKTTTTDTKKSGTAPAPTPAKTTDTKKAADDKKVAAAGSDTKKSSGSAGGGGGDLTREEVQQVIRSSFAKVRNCGRISSVKGKMNVSFIIKGDGRVSNAQVKSAEFANTTAGACVIKAVNEMKFRATGKDMPITYPFEIL